MAQKGLGWSGTFFAAIASGVVLLIWAVAWPPSEMLAWLQLAAKSAWAWLIATAALAWNGITYPIPVPVWLAAAVAALCAWLSLRRPAPAASVVLDEVDDLGRAIIELLAAADGEFVPIDVLAIATKMRRLVVTHVAESLQTRGFLDDSIAPSGTLLRPSPRGTAFAIKNALMGNEATLRRMEEAGDDWRRRYGRI